MARKHYCSIWILTFIMTAYAFADEPGCSKYDFEMKMIEKMVKLEFQVERLNSDLNESYRSLADAKDRFDSQAKDLESISEMRNELAATIEKAVDEALLKKSNELAPIAAPQTPNVLFKARWLSNTSPSIGDNLIFSNIMSNYGDGYNKVTGIFTAPVGGTYHFGLTLCLVYNKGIVVGFIVDDKKTSANAIYGDIGHQCHTVSTVEVLKKGHQVRVERLRGYATITTLKQSEAYRWNFFYGTLIHQ